MIDLDWLCFLVKYKIGLAKEGEDFITLGQEEEEEQEYAWELQAGIYDPPVW